MCRQQTGMSYMWNWRFGETSRCRVPYQYRIWEEAEGRPVQRDMIGQSTKVFLIDSVRIGLNWNYGRPRDARFQNIFRWQYCRRKVTFPPPPHKIYILFEAEGVGGDLKYSNALHLEKFEVFGWIDFTYFDMESIEFQNSWVLVRKACGRTLIGSHWDHPERKKGNILFHFLFLHHTWRRTF